MSIASRQMSGGVQPPLPPPSNQSQSSSGSSSLADMTFTNIGPNRDPKRWLFSKEELKKYSMKLNPELTSDGDLLKRQKAANLIQEMGQRLHVPQLCINTAIVYMHRFYIYNSFKKFTRYTVAPACIFLSAKIEENPRKLEHVIKATAACCNFELDQKIFKDLSDEIVYTESFLLMVLGFDLAIDHPHTFVVKSCTLVNATTDIAQISYYMATNSLHLTTLCLRYPPALVACVCINFACKWGQYSIPISKEGKQWYKYVDETATLDLLEELTQEFLVIFDKCPSKLKNKIMNLSTKNTKQEHKSSSGRSDSKSDHSIPKPINQLNVSKPGSLPGHQIKTGLLN